MGEGRCERRVGRDESGEVRGEGVDERGEREEMRVER